MGVMNTFNKWCKIYGMLNRKFTYVINEEKTKIIFRNDFIIKYLYKK
jgi:hypothetical protein